MQINSFRAMNPYSGMKKQVIFKGNLEKKFPLDKYPEGAPANTVVCLDENAVKQLTTNPDLIERSIELDEVFGKKNKARIYKETTKKDGSRIAYVKPFCDGGKKPPSSYVVLKSLNLDVRKKKKTKDNSHVY